MGLSVGFPPLSGVPLGCLPLNPGVVGIYVPVGCKGGQPLSSGTAIYAICGGLEIG
jgi:hypothetical protein